MRERLWVSVGEVCIATHTKTAAELARLLLTQWKARDERGREGIPTPSLSTIVHLRMVGQ